MVKLLSGLELQGFIKQRQLRQVRNLRQQFGIVPKLLIIQSLSAGDVVDTYVRMKNRYANDISIEVEVKSVDEADMQNIIKGANIDSNIQGIIVQLPLKDLSQTQSILNTIDSKKDIDGLGDGADYPSATAQAIDWLLAGYNVELKSKEITIVGNGKLVGQPLSKMWHARQLDVEVLDIDSRNPQEVISQSDVIVSATGVPNLVKTTDIKNGAIVVDAGTASESGQIVGDVSADARQRDDLTITPVKGGVGPLTITVLFDHLIEACLKQAGQLPS